MNPVHSLPHYYLMVHFNVFLSSKPMSFFISVFILYFQKSVTSTIRLNWNQELTQAYAVMERALKVALWLHSDVGKLLSPRFTSIQNKAIEKGVLSYGLSL
jgi:hypothetical protein